MSPSQGLARAFLLLPATVLALAAAPALLAAPAATPTPTPRPKLSGGFGRTPAAASTGDGQSLADVVRAAAAAREKKGQKPVAINNDNLVRDPRKGRLSTSQVKPPLAPTPAVGARPQPGSTTPGPATPAPSASIPAIAPTAPPAPAAEEAAWRERAHSAHQRVEDLKARIAALDGETKQLENDFYRWDDGQYRDRVIKPSWDKKREELETAKRELVTAERDLADLPEQARKAGALPGWLRE
jgi:hypothetical protein